MTKLPDAPWVYYDESTIGGVTGGMLAYLDQGVEYVASVVPLRYSALAGDGTTISFASNVNGAPTFITLLKANQLSKQEWDVVCDSANQALKPAVSLGSETGQAPHA